MCASRPSCKAMLEPPLQWRQAMNVKLPVEANDFVRSLVAQASTNLK